MAKTVYVTLQEHLGIEIAKAAGLDPDEVTSATLSFSLSCEPVLSVQVRVSEDMVRKAVAAVADISRMSIEQRGCPACTSFNLISGPTGLICSRGAGCKSPQAGRAPVAEAGTPVERSSDLGSEGVPR